MYGVDSWKKPTNPPRGYSEQLEIIMKTYQRIHSLSQAIENCIESGNDVWKGKHEESLNTIMERAPSGSGFDSGTNLLMVTEDQMTFETFFHHMDEMGGYDGWTSHVVYVKPSFEGITLRITGKDKNDIKDYIGDVFHEWLNTEIN